MEFSIEPKGLSTKGSYSGISQDVNLKHNSSQCGHTHEVSYSREAIED